MGVFGWALGFILGHLCGHEPSRGVNLLFDNLDSGFIKIEKTWYEPWVKQISYLFMHITWLLLADHAGFCLGRQVLLPPIIHTPTHSCPLLSSLGTLGSTDAVGIASFNLATLLPRCQTPCLAAPLPQDCQLASYSATTCYPKPEATLVQGRCTKPAF